MATTLIPDYIVSQISSEYGITITNDMAWYALGEAQAYTGQTLIASSDTETITEYIDLEEESTRIILKDKIIRSVSSVEIDLNEMSSDWLSYLEIEDDGVMYNRQGFVKGRVKIVYKAGYDISQDSVSLPDIQRLVKALCLLAVATYKDGQQQANIITAEGEMDIQAKRCREQAYKILDYYKSRDIG